MAKPSGPSAGAIACDCTFTAYSPSLSPCAQRVCDVMYVMAPHQVSYLIPVCDSTLCEARDSGLHCASARAARRGRLEDGAGRQRRPHARERRAGGRPEIA